MVTGFVVSPTRATAAAPDRGAVLGPVSTIMTTDALTQAAEAHQKALEAQQAMRDAARARDAAVRAAHEAGHSAPGIAKALGVNRQRVYQMLGKGNV